MRPESALRIITEMGILYVVATPIGNLEDMSPRARRVLGAVALVAAEDTRVARRLISEEESGTRPRFMSYNEHNREQRIPEIILALDHGDVALVSDAGTPGISDPGVELVAAAREAGFRVEAVPGPSAAVAALSVAGLRAREWTFVGFLPRQAGQLRRMLEGMTGKEANGQTGKALAGTIVAYEAPSRLRKTLTVMAEVLPDRRIAVCRELTKVHEEVFVGTAAKALEHFTEVRGEIVVVVEPSPPNALSHTGRRGTPVDEREAGADVGAEVRLMREIGLTQSQSAALLAARYGLSRRKAYQMWLEGGPR